MESFNNIPLQDSKQIPLNQWIRVRCPKCLKLYSVDPREVKQSQPKFACDSCETRFWIAYPESLGQDELIGFPVEWIESKSNTAASQEVSKPTEAEARVSEAQVFHCPKCEAPYAGGQKECGSCGIVFAKYEALLEDKDLSVPASTDLKVRWDEVLDAYESQDRHQGFIYACQQADNLLFAAARYNAILSANPSDELAQKYLQQIHTIMQVKVDRVPEPSTAVASRRARGRRRLPFIPIILVLSAITVAVGFFIPGMRNLVGFGVSLLFLVLALRYSFKSVL